MLRICRQVALFLLIWVQTGLASATLMLLKQTPSIQNTHPLQLGAYVAGGSLQIHVSPTDAQAAVFRLTGQSGKRFRLMILGDRLLLRGLRYGQIVSVQHFRFGGDISALGAGRFDLQGCLNNVRLGASWQLDRYLKADKYTGKSIIRIIYI